MHLNAPDQLFTIWTQIQNFSEQSRKNQTSRKKKWADKKDKVFCTCVGPSVLKTFALGHEYNLRLKTEGCIQGIFFPFIQTSHSVNWAELPLISGRKTKMQLCGIHIIIMCMPHNCNYYLPVHYNNFFHQIQGNPSLKHKWQIKYYKLFPYKEFEKYFQ